MPTVIGRHELTLVPEYRIVGLLDSQNTNLEGSDKAITESVRTVAALDTFRVGGLAQIHCDACG